MVHPGPALSPGAGSRSLSLSLSRASGGGPSHPLLPGPSGWRCSWGLSFAHDQPFRVWGAPKDELGVYRESFIDHGVTPERMKEVWKGPQHSRSPLLRKTREAPLGEGTLLLCPSSLRGRSSSFISLLAWPTHPLLHPEPPSPHRRRRKPPATCICVMREAPRAPLLWAGRNVWKAELLSPVSRGNFPCPPPSPQGQMPFFRIQGQTE